MKYSKTEEQELVIKLQRAGTAWDTLSLTERELQIMRDIVCESVPFRHLPSEAGGYISPQDVTELPS